MIKIVKNGIINENPTFVQVIGMCPLLAVTTSAINGLGMGAATTAVLMCSNVAISLLRRVIPEKARIPAYIVIIASFVTMVDLLMQAFAPPALNKALGIFIPLIVVNCIILARAESFAGKNRVLPSLLDGLGMGLGFTGALFIIGSIRELLGAGALFDRAVLPEAFPRTIIMILPPGAFFTLAFLMAGFKYLRSGGKSKQEGGET
ncbi:MAG: electron transport complex subunit E [Clostridiales bacterium]|jgi:electron transport complex protein RnfE|nr:electron transport complex subunit E [Clostridiales bacterium]